MYLVDVTLHMLLVYTLLFVIFIAYGRYETVHIVDDMIEKIAKPAVAEGGVLPRELRDKMVALGVPSNCTRAENMVVIVRSACILLAFVCLFLLSLMFRPEGSLKYVWIQNVVIFGVVMIFELLMIKFVLLKYTVITPSEVQVAVKSAAVAAISVAAPAPVPGAHTP